jgi:hypothetical protein
LKTKGMHIFNAEGLHTDELREGAPIKFRFQKVDRGKFYLLWFRRT